LELVHQPAARRLLGLLRAGGHAAQWRALGHGAGFHPGGTRLASLSDDGTLRLWDVVEGVQMLETTLSSDHDDLAFSADGTQLFVGGGTVRIFDSVSQAERSAEMTHLLAARLEAEHFVRTVLRDATDYTTAAARIRADSSLSTHARAMARDILLTEMVARLPVRPK
jgi:WD domain, G-beta repeat